MSTEQRLESVERQVMMLRGSPENIDSRLANIHETLQAMRAEIGSGNDKVVAELKAGFKSLATILRQIRDSFT